ncbi:ABC transport system permease protein [Thermotomaculum hydrothermale]|uniref:ABC transport system permease protein n=1 Tax=Thermotomaculum hydrothermale TaxID=981385 RepID=A0A7R6PXG9_9BACT|nr:ABC transporter permease [Thermotomaculum hydrothermale]BBB32510.1 ABC transport system permease protein [Thermotomaculum hydrothermale]
MIIENIKLALRSIKANKLRSFLTTLGIIIGVASVITIISLVQGIFNTIQVQQEQMGTNIITIQPYRATTNFIELLKEPPKLTMEDALVLKKQIDDIENLAPIVFASCNASSKKLSHSSSLYGVYPLYQDINGQYVETGRFINYLDLKHRRKVCVLGKEVVDSLKLGENPIGKFILIDNVPVKIIGVMEKKGSFFGRSMDDYVFMPFSTVIDIKGKNLKDHIYIQLTIKNLEKINQVKEVIEKILRKRHKIKEGKADDFKVQTQQDILESFKKTTSIITLIVAGIVGISLIVGGIGIMNIMLVSVTERTKEIGVRKAVGATKKHILYQFLVESVILSLVGGIIGILIGLGLGFLISKMIPNFPGMYVPFWGILLAFIFSSLVGVIFGVFPAYKAAKLNPIDALRYE